MKILVIGTSNTVELFRLVGCRGYVVESESGWLEIKDQIDDLSDVATVLISSQVAEMAPKFIDKVREQNTAVLVLDAKSEVLSKQVEKVLGIKLKGLKT